MGSSPPAQVVYNAPVQGSKQKGFSHIYRNPNIKQLTTTPEKGINNLRDLIEMLEDRYGDKDTLGKIVNKDDKLSVDYLSMKQTKAYAEHLGRALIAQKLIHFNKEDGLDMQMIGIHSKNRREWYITDVCCMLYGFTTIPLYDTLGVENLSYCLNQTGITTLFTANDTVKIFLKLKDKGSIQNLVLFDRLSAEQEKQIQEHKIKVFYFEDLTTDKQYATKQPSYKDFKIVDRHVHTFSYTSGTTGPPKGAMITHKNFVALISAYNSHPARMNDKDDYLSFLPLPHVMERAVAMCVLYAGARLICYQGDMAKIKEDCQIVKPTVFVAVPRLFNKIVEAVEGQVNQAGGVKKCLFDMGLNTKRGNLINDGSYSHGFYDSVVFKAVRQKFGGRIRYMLTGSAPMTEKTNLFMKAVMGCPLVEGYGQTENTAAAFITNFVDPVSNHVGGVVTALEFKLADLPEMNYTADDVIDGKPSPRGEIWLRGQSVFLGYFKNREKTDQALTSDGWLRTGDVGQLLHQNKAIKIIDRKKNIFKLQQGEYVASEKVQQIYRNSPVIDEVFIYGDSTQNFCVAVIAANEKGLTQLANKNSIKGSFEELSKDKQLRTLLCKELNGLGKKQGLHSFENAKNIYLDTKTFQERDILTNTMKLQRHEAKKYYQNDIQAMYKEGELKVKD